MSVPDHKQSSHQFAVRLMQHLVVPTFVIDADRKVTIWNRACERLTGVSAEAVIGTSNHWSAFYDEPRDCLADIVARGETATLDNLYVTHTLPSESGLGLRAENWCTMPKMDTRLYLAIDAGPIFDDQGKLIAVVETLRDMTAHKEAQIQLENLATHDALTGLANRRAFDEQLRAEWLRAQREFLPLSLLVLDVDHFKLYNDHFGHQQGDLCLRHIAGCMQRAVMRPADLATRYGGEEFAIIMPNTDSQGARTVAERISTLVRESALPHPKSPNGGHVTVSIGIASMIPEAHKAADTLFACADQALYAAKAAGRDRIVTA